MSESLPNNSSYSAWTAKPSNYDVVLGGGSASTPNYGVVLGGLPGVKHRLQSKEPNLRMAALAEALQQGNQGLNLVIRALDDESTEVQWFAYQLLRDRPEPRAKTAIALISDTGINYRKLNNLLSAKRWQAADEYTNSIMLAICGLEPKANLNASHMENFPCRDLEIIDRLWMKHSKNRFGFSVQRDIWQECVRWRWDKGEVWSMFGDKVGWRSSNFLTGHYHWKKYRELNFSSQAPIGHLPFLSDLCGIFLIEAICDRLITCQLPS